MDDSAPEAPATRRRRMPWIAFLAIAILLLVGLFALLNSERALHVALRQVGETLGLEITSSSSEVRLRGTPTLQLRDLIVRAPGADSPLLTAERMLLSLPWSTLRARGETLEFKRVEADTPVLDVDALQAWLATRPDGDTRMPVLHDGLQVDGGTLVADDWRIESIDLALASLRPQQPVKARASGRYRNGDTSVPFDLHLSLAKPAPGGVLGLSGHATLQRPGWQIPADLQLSGVLRADTDGIGIDAMTLAAEASYESGSTRAPFAFGLAGPLHYSEGRLTLDPAGVALRVDATNRGNPIPELDAQGALRLQQSQLKLHLQGALADWPAAWPALPAPLQATDAALPFALDYSGASDLSDTAAISLQRGTTYVQGHVRLATISNWLDDKNRHSPLPPLDAHATAPRLEVAGAVLEGVEISIDDPTIDAPPMKPDNDSAQTD